MLDSDEARLMADIGFIAASRGMDAQALPIFEGLVAARPGEEAGPIGLALVHLLRDAPAAALDELRRLPPSDAVLVFQGLALLRLGDASRARDLLATVADTALDEAHRTLAHDLLASSDRR